MSLRIKIIFLSFFAFSLIHTSFAQFDPNPQLEWRTIETAHFYVHYHLGTERTANTVAKIAEEIYGPITSLYQWTPKDKTSWIINDESDYSNGATDYYGNRIEIASSNLDFDLRGTHDWLRNVITHEFTHVIQVPSAMKFSQKVPSIYFQFLNYEKERRPDVLYGYPNTIISYPFAGSVVPAWYAEGTAQYQRQQTGYDFWDGHRDMILRMRTLDNKLLTWEEMGQFASSTTYKAESIYNAGFNLIRYIAATYGEDKLREISGYMGRVTDLNIDGAFKSAIGKSGKDLYNEWKAFLQRDYTERVKDLKTNLVEGDQIAKVGFANYFPEYSPNGKKIAYLSNKEYDYGATSLWIHYIDGKKDDEQLIAGVASSFSWSPDGKKILFSRRNKPTIHEKSIFDIYEYDIAKKDETQVTFGLRAHSPAYSYDGKNICFADNHDGTQNLYVASNPNGKKIKEVKQITNFKSGEQIYAPKWSPDGSIIVFDYSRNDSRGIAKIDVNTGSIEFLFQSDSADFRSPVFSRDGSALFFASDMTGIYNIYKYDWLNEAKAPDVMQRQNNLKQITNCLGGAFMPDVDSLGNLTFASWQSEGYKINQIKNFSDLNGYIESSNARYKRPDKVVEKIAEQNGSNSTAPRNKFDWPKLHNFEDSSVTYLKSTSYNNVATPLFIIPVIKFDNYNKSGKVMDAFKPGFYFYSQDVLGKMGIFGGASINRNFERDLFLQFDYDNGVPFAKKFFIKQLGFVPEFTIAGYNISRKTNANLVAGLDSIPVDITYDLLEFDFNMAFKIINSYHKMNAEFTLSKYSSKLSTFLIPTANVQVPSSSTNYFTGRDLSLAYTYTNFRPNRNDDINPIGRRVKLKYDYQFSSLNPTISFDNSGNQIETFQEAKFHSLEANWLEAYGLFNNQHSISLNLKAGSILGKTQDNFFDFYASGYPGMKGYPFYAIGGNHYATANLTYRFPVAQNIDIQFLQFYFDKLFFSVYGDWGNAWDGKATQLKDFKKDIGFELRLQSFSYYVYPTSFAFNASYGMDQFSRLFPTTVNSNELVTYGKEWRFYFTVLFSFDAIEDLASKFKF